MSVPNSETQAVLAQLFLIGFRGLTLAEAPWLARALKSHPPGGVILFDRNIDRSRQNIESPAQLSALTASLQKTSRTPLLIAVDQEGGRVCRLKEADGFAPTLSAARLAETGVAATARYSEAMAAELAAMGVNLNFAPVVDLNLNPQNPIIARYERSFGSDPDQVVAHAQAVIAAHHRHGVACCLKHFPGHGSATGDSHLGFVDVSACWQAEELEPYRRLIHKGYKDGVMTAHLINRQLDTEDRPATLSPIVIEGMLREDFGFRGVVFSDDLQMRAISGEMGMSEAIGRALLAGVDMLVIGNNLSPREDALENGIKAVSDMLASGRLSWSRVEESLARINRLKTRLQGAGHAGTISHP